MNALVAKTRIPYLTNEEILENIRAYRTGKNPIYLHGVINNFIKLLIKKARKYKKSGINVGDLIHYGIEGLIEAIDRSFNLDANERFITYITIIIERRMKDGLDIQRSAVMFPKNIMTQQRKFRHEYHEQCEQSNQSTEEIIHTVPTLPNKTIYSKMNIEDFLKFKDILSVEQMNTIDTSIEDKLDKDSLQKDLGFVLEGILTDLEQKVIIHSFGLKGESPKAFDAISLKFDISAQKVRKIRNSALIKIRNNPKGMNLLKKYFD